LLSTHEPWACELAIEKFENIEKFGAGIRHAATNSPGRPACEHWTWKKIQGGPAVRHAISGH